MARNETAAIVATILFQSGRMWQTAYKTMTVDGNPSQKDQLEAAVGLQSLGLTAGDRVAVIGDGSFAIWARLARFKIVSEVSSLEPGNREFWASSWERRSLVYQRLRDTGAKVVAGLGPSVTSSIRFARNTDITPICCAPPKHLALEFSYGRIRQPEKIRVPVLFEGFHRLARDGRVAAII